MELLGVIFGMAAYILVAFVWFRVIFAKQYVAMGGADPKTKPNMKQWIGALVNAFLVTVVLSWILTSLGVEGVGDSLFSATALWAGLIFPPYFTSVRWLKMSMQQLFLQSGYMLVAMWVISVILALV